MSGVEGLETIELFIECCLIEGKCLNCPFYIEDREWKSGRCLGSKKIGARLKGMTEIVRKELNKK